MNYRELVKKVAQKQDVTFQKAESIVDTLLETIVDEVSQGNSVRLKRFATLKPTYSKARNRYIPGSDEVKEFPPSISLKLVPSKKLKRELQSTES